MATRTLTVKLVGDHKNLDKAFKSAGSKAKTFGRTMGKVALGVGGLFVGAAVAAKPLIDKASDLNEELSKSDAVFGGAAKSVQDFAAAADEGLGLSQRAALESINKFGQFGKAAGLTGDDLGVFGKDLAILSADLASFNNLEVEDAAAKLAAGLSGEAEPLKQLGIFMNAAQVEAKGLEMGLGGLEGKLTDQEKILARQALIFEQTSDAQGDFAKTSDGLANKSRILSAKWENLQATLGQKLLPLALKAGDALLKLFDVIGPHIGPVMDRVESAIRKVIGLFSGGGEGGLEGAASGFFDMVNKIWGTVADLVVQWAPVVWEKIQVLAKAFWEWVEEVAPPLLEKLGELLSKVLTWITENLGVISDKLIEWADAFIRWVAPLIPPLLEELAKLAVAIIEWAVTDLAPKLATTLYELGKDGLVKLWDALVDIWDADVKPWLADLPGRVVTALGDLLGVLWSAGGDLIQGLWDGAKAKMVSFKNWLWNEIKSPFTGGGSDDEIMDQFFPDGTSSPQSGVFNPTGQSGGRSASGGFGGASVIQIMLDGRVLAEAVADESQRMGGLAFKVVNAR